jgi:hypothetical protein
MDRAAISNSQVSLLEAESYDECAIRNLIKLPSGQYVAKKISI